MSSLEFEADLLTRWYTDFTMTRKSTASSPSALDAKSRSQMKRWLENWQHVGQMLEQERWDRVMALTEADAARDAMRLFELWQPDWPTDDGEELLLHQRVFARARRG